MSLFLRLYKSAKHAFIARKPRTSFRLQCTSQILESRTIHLTSRNQHTMLALTTLLALTATLAAASPAPQDGGLICFKAGAGCSPNIFPTCCDGLKCVPELNVFGPAHVSLLSVALGIQC